MECQVCTQPCPRAPHSHDLLVKAVLLPGEVPGICACVTLDEIFVLTVHSKERGLYANPTLRTAFCFLGCLQGEQQLWFCISWSHTFHGTVLGQQGALRPPQSLSSRLTLGLLHTSFPLF